MQRAITEKRGLPFDGRVPVFPVRYGTLWDDEKGESSANSGRKELSRKQEGTKPKKGPAPPSAAPAVVENGSKPIYSSEEC